MCKVPVHARHSIKINEFKSIGCYYIPQTLLCMNYGEYKNIWDEKHLGIGIQSNSN